MIKVNKYKWGELEVNVTEVPFFDNKSKSFTGVIPCAKVQDIDFNKLTEEIIKHGDDCTVPFVITFDKEWVDRTDEDKV